LSTTFAKIASKKHAKSKTFFTTKGTKFHEKGKVKAGVTQRARGHWAHREYMYTIKKLKKKQKQNAFLSTNYANLHEN
jgi:hypothetical protein